MRNGFGYGPFVIEAAIVIRPTYSAFQGPRPGPFLLLLTEQ